MQRIVKNLAAFLMAGLLFETAPSLTGQQAPQMPAAPSRISVTTELVLVNVVARDKKGNLIRDLKKEDFALLEGGKKQGIHHICVRECGRAFDRRSRGSHGFRLCSRRKPSESP